MSVTLHHLRHQYQIIPQSGPSAVGYQAYSDQVPNCYSGVTFRNPQTGDITSLGAREWRRDLMSIGVQGQSCTPQGQSSWDFALDYSRPTDLKPPFETRSYAINYGSFVDKFREAPYGLQPLLATRPSGIPLLEQGIYQTASRDLALPLNAYTLTQVRFPDASLACPF